MSSKKPNTPSTVKEQADGKNFEQTGPDGPETTPVASPTLEELEKELADVRAQAAEYKDGWQRAVAEFQNYRRRIEAEKADTYQMAVGSIIKRYLPILDDMDRAMEARPKDLAWSGGIELIHRKLQAILDLEGITPIQAEGQKFDPTIHEAISQEPAEGVESGTVIAVVRKGYMQGERVIRPAMVRVAQ